MKILHGSDMHIPYQDEEAVEAFTRVAAHEEPDFIILQGDNIDCQAISDHSPTFGASETRLVDDLARMNEFLDELDKYVKCRIIVMAGNHEYRLRRRAARDASFKAALDLVDFREHLVGHRSSKRFRYVEYGPFSGSGDSFPHVEIFPERALAVHGWHAGAGALRNNLKASRGATIITGHTHRLELMATPSIWDNGMCSYSVGVGCLCRLVAWYGDGKPTEWAQGYALTMVQDDGIHHVWTGAIHRGRTIIPSGDKEI